MTTFLKRIDGIDKHLKLLTASSITSIHNDLVDMKIYDTFYNYCEMKLLQKDLKQLEDGGIPKKTLFTIKEKLADFKKKFSFQIDKTDKPENIVSMIFYKYNLPYVRSICSDLQNIMDEYDGPYKQESYLVDRTWRDKNGKNYTLTIDNPYTTIPTVLEDAQEFLEEISSIENIDLSRFKYEEQFQILQTIESQIQELSIDQKEKDILLVNWSRMFLKSLYLLHVQMKLTEKMLLAEKKEGITDSQLGEIVNFKFVNRLSDTFMESVFAEDIEVDKLNKIYQKYQDEEEGNVLKPFIEEFLPYFQNLFTVPELIKYCLSYDSKREMFLSYMFGKDKTQYEKDYNRQFDTKYTFPPCPLVHYIPTVYLNLLPYKLNNPPNESFYTLFNFCIRGLNYNTDTCFDRERRPTTKILFLFDVDEIDGDLDTLEIQKYYICWSMVHYIRTAKPGTYCDQLPIAFALSLLPWSIDDECEEARTLEKYLHENVKREIADCHGYHYDWTWYEFITKEVWPATEPLDMNTIRNKMNPELHKVSEPQPNFQQQIEGCCSIF